MDKACLATNASGERCRSRPVRPSGYCWWHDPGVAEVRAQKRREGGAHRSNRERAKRQLADPLTADEIRSHLGVVFKGVIVGKIEPNVGTAAATIARALLDVAKVAEVEAQVAQLRRDMAAFSERRGAS